MWILRLSLAAYRLGRRVAIAGVVSAIIIACRGITAGSTFATTELRVLMISALDFVHRAFPSLPLQVYVDDLFVAAEGSRQRVCRSLPVATRLLVHELARVRLEISDTKSEGIASSPTLALALSSALRDLRIRFSLGCRSLGGNMSATRQRRASLTRGRITALRARRSRFARLRAGGVHTARFFRAGWNAAVSWGIHVVGIATTPLQAWRREVARGCSAAASGKSVDLALVLADSRASQATDPAFDAHTLPLVYWAHAVWSSLRPASALADALRSAQRRIDSAASTWSVVTRPAAAVLATALRLGWAVPDYCSFVDDLGYTYNLRRSSPALVKRAVVESVRRWQTRQVAQAFPSAQLQDGIRLEPLVRLLARTSEGWTSAEQAQLRSAVVGGQWTQARLHAAGLAPSCLCPLCGLAPGTLAHRLWWCAHPELVAARSKHVPPWLLATARQGSADGIAGSWERALFPLPPLPSLAERTFDTFEWDVEPEGQAAHAVVYPDASRCGGRATPAASYGWAFVARDADGQTVAAAHGVPPAWVRSVAAAETWALAQAARASLAGSSYRSDCLGAVSTAKRGVEHATSARQACAEAWGIFFTSAGEDGTPDVEWIPAHTTHEEVGTTISAADRDGNDAADGAAKGAAASGQLSVPDTWALANLDSLVNKVARWVGHAGVLVSKPGLRDTAASQSGKRARRTAQAAHLAAQPPSTTIEREAALIARPYSSGGHLLRNVEGRWKCLVCRCSSATWSHIAGRSCPRSAADRWARLAEADVAAGEPVGRGHTRWLSDDTIWCSTCGQYATHAAVGLKRACHPIRSGTRYKRRLLAAGIHPWTMTRFVAAPVPEHEWQDPASLASLAAPGRPQATPVRGGQSGNPGDPTAASGPLFAYALPTATPPLVTPAVVWPVRGSQSGNPDEPTTMSDPPPGVR